MADDDTEEDEPSVRWQWQSGHDSWTQYAPDQAASLERAWAAGGGLVKVDAERQVVVRPGGQMRQERVDAPEHARRRRLTAERPRAR